MKFFVLLATFAAAFAAPAPQEEESPAAIPYVHEEIAAEPYVHEEIAAEAYVHDEPVETHEIEAEPYVHEEPAAPVAYAFAAPFGYPYAVAHTGCVNSVGSVVP